MITPTVKLALSILLALTNGCLLHQFANRDMSNTGNILLFNGVISIIWIAVVLCVSRSFSVPSQPTLLLGVGYGVVIAGFLLSKMLAYSAGNMSLTVMLGSSSLIIPTLLGTVIWQEQIHPIQGIGLMLLLASMALCTGKVEKTSASKKWLFYCLLFFVFSGLSGLVFKAHQNSTGKDEVAELMLLTAVVSSLLLILTAFALNRRAGLPQPRLPRRAWKFIPFCGICSCLYNWLNIECSGALPSVIFFPVFNGCVILGTSLVSRFLFREKLSWIQIAGIVSGTFSLMLIAKVLF